MAFIAEEWYEKVFMPSKSAGIQTDWVQVEGGIWDEGHLVEKESLPPPTPEFKVPYRDVFVWCKTFTGHKETHLKDDEQVRPHHAKNAFKMQTQAMFEEQLPKVTKARHLRC